jgi:hypothetical protein
MFRNLKQRKLIRIEKIKHEKKIIRKDLRIPEKFG